MLLSICIPTYNRHECLLETVDVLVGAICELNMTDQVEIIVSDNSDACIQAENRKSLSEKTSVNYFANEGNVGFSRNVERVVSLACGEFFWIVPDNDGFCYDSLCEMLLWLNKNKDSFDCLFLSYRYTNFTGKETIAGDYGIKGSVSLSEFFTRGELPFILLSSAIIRKKVKSYEDLLKRFSDNSFIQIPIIMSNLDSNSRMKQFYSFVVEYNVEYEGRFNPAKCYTSLLDVLEYLKVEFGILVPGRKYREYISLWRGILLGSVGVFCVYELNEAKNDARSALFKHLGFKSVLFCLFSFCPQAFQRGVVLRYSALACALKEYSSVKLRLLKKIQDNLG